jgi:Tfp pilus assembly protein PilV
MNKSGCDGIILLEAMLAIVLMGMFVVTCMRGISQLLRVTSSSDTVTGASVCAQTFLADVWLSTNEDEEKSGTTNWGENILSWSIHSDSNADTALRTYRYAVGWKSSGKDESFSFTTGRTAVSYE